MKANLCECNDHECNQSFAAAAAASVARVCLHTIHCSALLTKCSEPLRIRSVLLLLVVLLLLLLLLLVQLMLLLLLLLLQQSVASAAHTADSCDCCAAVRMRRAYPAC
jgi:hypothetical protein